MPLFQAKILMQAYASYQLLHFKQISRAIIECFSVMVYELSGWLPLDCQNYDRTFNCHIFAAMLVDACRMVNWLS